MEIHESSSSMLTSNPSHVDYWMHISCIQVQWLDSLQDCAVNGKPTLHIRVGIDQDGNSQMSTDSLDHMSMRIRDSHVSEGRIELLVLRDGENVYEKIQIPLSFRSCVSSFFTLERFDATICLVHTVATCISELDRFEGEQEFLFSCLEIQDELLLHQRPPRLPLPSFESIPHQSVPISQADHDPIELELANMHKLLCMLIFGEIVSFEVPLADVSIENGASIFIVFNVPGKSAEVTPVSRACISSSPNETAGKKIFAFNRPITTLYGQRLTLQVIQSFWSGAQKLLGYGYCDLELDNRSLSREVEVAIWRPRATNEYRDYICGTFSPLADAAVCQLPRYVNRKDMQTISGPGRVRIHIQRTGYC